MTRKENYFRKRKMSFNYAFKGIWQAIKKEANFRIHIMAAIFVVLLGLFFQISTFEWLVIILTIGCVMGAELFNSAIENMIDISHPEKNKKAGQVKDLAAGAVLVTAITAAIIGLIIFVPKILILL